MMETKSSSGDTNKFEWDLGEARQGIMTKMKVSVNR